MKPTLYPLIILLVLVQGCSPQRRLNRLLERHPELTISDTVHVRDSVMIPAVKTDTLVLLSRLTDTITLEKERLSIKLHRQHDTLYVEGECKADTIIREIKIPVEKIRLIKPNLTSQLIGKIPWLIIGTIIFLLILKLVKPNPPNPS